MSIIDQIRSIALPIIESKGAYAIELAVRGEGRGRRVEAFIDSDNGVTTDLCAEISRGLARSLDAADIVPGSYHLVVSSPGIDRPLKFPRQYPKNIGRRMTVRWKNQYTVQRIDGKLVEATEGGITLQLVNGDVQQISFDAILDARVLSAF